MGGVAELIDPLNMGEQVRYVQLGKEVEGSKRSLTIPMAIYEL